MESTQSETVETTFQSERGLGPRMKIPEFPKPENLMMIKRIFIAKVSLFGRALGWGF